MDAALIRSLHRLTVNDLACSLVRRPAHRQHIQFHRQRLFSTRPPIRQLQQREVSPIDDVAIPFIQIKGSESVRQVERESHLGKKDGISHVEVELVPGTAAQATGSVETADQSQLSLAVDIQAQKTLEKDGFDSPITNRGSVIEESSEVTAKVPANSSRMSTENEAEASAKRQIARLKRKLRRIESGKYNRTQYGATKQLPPESIGAVDQMTSVLDKIDSMEGDDIVELHSIGDSASASPIEAQTSGSRDHTTAVDMQATSNTEVADEPLTQAVNSGKRNKVKLERAVAGVNRTDSKGRSNGKRQLFGAGSKETRNTDPHKTPIVKKEQWQVQKAALDRKFGEQGWRPPKRLSPDTLEGIRTLHASDPQSYTTEVIAKHFKITPEAIRRILRSKWKPNDDETESRRKRWEKRGIKKWQEMADEGMRPPSKWRALGVTSAEKTEDGRPTWRKKRRSSSGDESASISVQRQYAGLAQRIL